MTTATNSDDNLPDHGASGASEAPTRKRPKPGERRLQILQTLAGMLEQPGAERITTAALSAKLGVAAINKIASLISCAVFGITGLITSALTRAMYAGSARGRE